MWTVCPLYETMQSFYAHKVWNQSLRLSKIFEPWKSESILAKTPCNFTISKENLLLPDYSSELKSMLHYFVKSVLIRSYYGPHFLALGLVSLCIQSDCAKIRAGITPNTDYFYAVIMKVLIFWKKISKNRWQKDEFITFNVHFPNCWAQWKTYAE